VATAKKTVMVWWTRVPRGPISASRNFGLVEKLRVPLLVLVARAADLVAATRSIVN
jgi:hypothetical protein